MSRRTSAIRDSIKWPIRDFCGQPHRGECGLPPQVSRMFDTELYQQVLGLTAPWKVMDVRLDVESTMQGDRRF